MQATKIVFTAITVLILLPILQVNLKNIWVAVKNKEKFPYVRFIGTLVACTAVLVLAVSLYQFTIGYQIPLAAERFHRYFITRVEKSQTLEEYQKALEDAGLASESFRPMEDTSWARDIVKAPDFTLSLSDRVGDDGSGAVKIYALYSGDGQEVYTQLSLKRGDGSKWKAVSHERLSEEELDEVKKIIVFSIVK